MQEQTYEQMLEKRLLAKYEVDAESGCWVWTGASTSNGYGYIWVGGGPEYAHRVMATFRLALDPGSGLYVLHTCDRPECINPEHLYLGTAKDNSRDAVSRGRLRGKKLTQTQVGEIRYRLAQGETQRSVALTYGVTTSCIGQIARRETWQTVSATAPNPDEEQDEC